MISPEIRSQSNLTGNALGPEEPTTDTDTDIDKVIIISENGAGTINTSLLSEAEKKQLRAIQARLDGVSQLESRQAESLVDAITLTPDTEKQREIVEHFLYTIARENRATTPEALEVHVDRVLGRVHELGKNALEATSIAKLAFSNTLLDKKTRELKKRQDELVEAQIESGLVAAAYEQAFDQLLQNAMGDPEAMSFIEQARDQARHSIDVPTDEHHDKARNASVVEARISTDELEVMAQHVTPDDRSPARGTTIDAEKVLNEALALARPSSEF